MTEVRHQKSAHTALWKVGVVSVIAALAFTPLSGAGSAFATTEPACGPLVAGVHEISLAAQLQAVGSGGTADGADCRLDAGYLLKEDITLVGTWTTIGSDANPFTGTFDGGGKTVTGLTISKADVDFQGMFSVTEGATIKDVSLAGVDVDGRDDTGALIGAARSTTTIMDVSVKGTVEGADRVGGVIGTGTGINVSRSNADVVVTARGRTGGGFIGDFTSGEIKDSHATGRVESGGDNLGGFVGLMKSNGLITGSSAETGVVWLGAGTDFRSDHGGFVGRISSGTIRLSLASGDVTFVDPVGGGQNRRVGGFAGRSDKGSISSSRATGNVRAAGSEVGGFVGENEEGIIASSQATGNVMAAASSAGGFVGLNNNGTIESSRATGDVTAQGFNVAGFVGRNDRSSSSISNSFSRGSSTGGQNVAGFVGRNSRSAAINNSFSTGKALATVEPTGVGGFVATDEATIQNSFWDTQSSKLLGSAAGTGKTRDEMVSITTFSSSGWDIVVGWVAYNPQGTPPTIWGICSGVNDDYPFLLWQFDADPCVASATVTTPQEKRSVDAGIHLDLQASVGDLVAGSSVVIGGQGLSGGSQYSLVVRSTPQTLAARTASALGNFSGRFSMPALSAGTHTLTLTANAADGSTLTLVQSFTVAANGTISAIGSPTGSQTSGLAATGVSGLDGGVGLAGLALLLGVAMVASSRLVRKVSNRS